MQLMKRGKEMKITGQVEYNDYLQGFLLHYKSNPSTMFLFYGILIFCGLLGISSLILSIIRGYPITYALIILFVALSVFLYRFVFLPIQIKNSFRIQKELNAPFEYEFTETHMLLNTLYNKSSIPFTEFVKWKENKVVFLLYYNPNCFYVIPKRFFMDPQQIDLIKAYIDATKNNKMKEIRRISRKTNWIIYAVLFLLIIILVLTNLVHSN